MTAATASTSAADRVSEALDNFFDPATVLRRRQIFRLAFGMTASSALAFGIAWPLSFITPVFTAKLLFGRILNGIEAEIRWLDSVDLEGS